MLKLVEDCGGYIADPASRLTREAFSATFEEIKTAYADVDKTAFAAFDEYCSSLIDVCDEILKEAIADEDPNNPPETDDTLTPDDDESIDSDDIGGIV